MDYEKILDKIIKEYEYDGNSYINLGQMIRENTGFENGKPLTPVFQNEILIEFEKLMIKFGYGKPYDMGKEVYTILPAWYDAQKDGGHLRYQANINNKEKEDRIDRDLQRKKLFYETDTAEKIFIDYPIVKRQKRNAYYFAAMTILCTIIATWIAIVQYLKCK